MSLGKFADKRYRDGVNLANMNPITEKDLATALELLGRTPRAPFVIATRCPDGTPQVLAADPVFLEDEIWKPFPAFLWLVCPGLKVMVAELEQQGLIKQFSQRLDTDEDFRKEFLYGQNEISHIRLDLARKIYPGVLPEHIEEILRDTTIAGSKDFRGVKCLHSHVAHYLVYGNNPIGKACLENRDPQAYCKRCKDSNERNQS